MNIQQLYILLCFILTGISIGILFDIFKIIRKSFKTSNIITYIHDFLFWILTGAILLFSIFNFNNGELRGYIFIGIILGIILYISIFSKHFTKIFVKIIVTFKKIINYPVKLCYNFMKKYLFSPIYSILTNIKTKLQKISNKIRKKDKIVNKIGQ